MAEDEDEDIAIDFSKWKNILRKKKDSSLKKDLDSKDKEIDKKIQAEKSEKEILLKEKELLEEKEEKVELNLEKEKIRLQGLRKEKLDIEEARLKVEQSESDEIAIDFSKWKKIFSKDKPAVEVKPSSDDDISFDFRKVIDFFVRHKVLLLLLLPLFLSVSIRSIPADLPVTHDWATSSVYNYIKAQIKTGVDAQYPNLPDANKVSIVDSEFQKSLTDQKSQIDQQIDATANYFKSQLQDEHGDTYLPDIDTYFWLRHAKNVLEHGHPGDIYVNGVDWDDHMIAPLGRAMPPDMFQAYALAYAFKFMSVFDSNYEFDRVCWYMPIIVSVLSVIPAFFIARKFAGNFGGFVAAGIVAIHPAFMVRSAAGVCDTDAYNVFFPLVIAWLFIEALEAKKLKLGVVIGVVGGIAGGVYSSAWGGWWFITDFLIVSVVVFLGFAAFASRAELKKNWRFLLKKSHIRSAVVITVVFFVVLAGFISVMRGFGDFKSSFTNPLGFSTIKDVGLNTVWPNVFTTVAEQNEVSFDGIIQNGGGRPLILIALLGCLLLAIDRKEKYSYNILYASLILVWIVATIYASTKGVRWVLLLVPALALGVGAAAGFVYSHTSRWLHKEFSINLTVARIVIIFLVTSFIFIYPTNMYASAKSTVKGEIPLINDAWVNALALIKANSTESAIITSWWDYGHWFKYLTDRRVTFDGTSQATPMAYWVGKAFLTDDEDVAIGILRMLDCGSYTAFDELDRVINKPYKSVDILNKIILADKEEARKVLLSYGLTSSQADSVLQRTHCDPPESFLIASDDMIGKSGVWAHFGSWDFRKATISSNVLNQDAATGTKFLRQEFNYSDSEAQSIYFKVRSLPDSRAINDWIAPWPSFASNLASCSKNNNMLQCGNGLQVDLATFRAFVPTQQGIMNITELVMPQPDGKLLRKRFYNNTLSVSALLIPENNGYQSILMAPELAASIFTRLYFLNGHGLKYFTPFTYQRADAFGAEVYVYRVNWRGGALNEMPGLVDTSALKVERRVRHILVNSSETAQVVLGKLQNGTPFSELANDYSTDTSATKGGDIGWVRIGQTVPEFEQAAFGLVVGKTSGIIKTQFGYHIVQVTGIRNITS